MNVGASGSDSFYVEFFTKNPHWSTAHPNSEEAARAAKILPLLSELAWDPGAGADRPLRMLDLGCGRGWLTYMADVYGECVGIDPVEGVVKFARKLFPRLRFEVGTAIDLADRGHSGQFDVVIASEVIEHVPPEDRGSFVNALRLLLAPNGALIVSSDRGEFYERWVRRGKGSEQPVEAWLTERELCDLVTRHGFVAAQHDRVYWEQPQLSPLHSIIASRRVADALALTRQRWLLEGMRFICAECQVWLFRRPL